MKVTKGGIVHFDSCLVMTTYTQILTSLQYTYPSKQQTWKPPPALPLSLVELCLLSLVDAEGSHMRGLDIIFPRLPEELAQSLLAALADKGKVTDDRLSAFLSVSRRVIRLVGCNNIRKSVLRQIPFRCPYLTYLDLSNCIQVSNTVVQDILQGCAHLQQLRLDNCRHITDAAFQPDQSLFYPLLACLSLKVLSFAGCSQITQTLVLNLVKAYRSLTQLNFSRCKRIDGNAIRTLLQGCFTLKTLNISFMDISDDAFYSSNPSSTRIVTELDVGQSKITDGALLSIAEHYPDLEVLRLRFCSQVTDIGMVRIAMQCHRLRHLDLNNCGFISDQTVSALAQHCSNLRWLSLSWCVHITDDSIVSLAQSCLHLEELLIIWCTQLTDMSIQALVAHAKKLKCLHVNGCSDNLTNCALNAARDHGINIVS
ncbi:hypothetical protein THRCLA_01208 [Thraustotheca clavata]|uniref:F-box/LRR-repeat protein 15-like leucin rich repeat domain-containing protein n=1 Tax=Thraustotheca clavata TaxID=74557 RepID=A0A1W0A9S4_9STRA|nr:hypothetical protein THRCLA_01208 [Thraustotheca clavata]